MTRKKNSHRIRFRAAAAAAVATTTLLVMLCSIQLRAQTNEELRVFQATPLLLDINRPAQENDRRDAGPLTSQTLQGYLSKPKGDGPFPAVIYLHACGGLDAVTRQRFSKVITESGFVLFAIDSFATRSITEACDHPMPDRQADALGALDYLSKLPFVDSKRMAAVGSSQGAIIVLNLALIDKSSSSDGRNRSKLKAVVAFYPLCRTDSRPLAVPTLILIGELDDWTPAKDCQQWTRQHGPGMASAKIVVYPGAYHAFDFPQFANALFAFGHRMKYDENAAQHAIEEMREFLSVNLSNKDD